MDGWLGMGSAKSTVTVDAVSVPVALRATPAGCAGVATMSVDQIATNAAAGAAIVVRSLRLFSRVHPPWPTGCHLHRRRRADAGRIGPESHNPARNFRPLPSLRAHHRARRRLA